MSNITSPTAVLPVAPTVARFPGFETTPAEFPCFPGYAVQGVLGRGGMGVVYRALDLRLNRPVALKMIAAEHAGPKTRERFRTEAQTLARLRHAHFVQIYEIGECHGRPFLALELVEGGSLGECLAVRGSLPPLEAATLVAILARAMHQAHMQGVVHRDLKPDNVLLSGGREPKITDFGLAKILDTHDGHTRTGAILGTPAYMAPEQARGGRAPITPATDVWALGAVLYECLTGRVPFDAEGSWNVLQQVIAHDPLPPRRLQPRVARDLDTICLKCLAKDPTRRYASAAALADDLERFVAGEDIAARPEGWPRRFARKLRRRPLAAAALILLTGALALAAGYWNLRRAQARIALADGRAMSHVGQHAAAAERFRGGLDRLGRLPGCPALRAELSRAYAAARLRDLTTQMIFLYDPEHLDRDGQRRLADSCRRLWEERKLILSLASSEDPAWAEQVRGDLRDLALRGLEMRLSLAAGDDAAAARAHEEAIVELEQLEELGLLCPLLEFERALHRQALGGPEPTAPDVAAPHSATEFHLLGRALLRTGRHEEAERAFRAGLHLDPGALFLHFDRAALAHRRGRHDDAIASFGACLALAPADAQAIIFARRGFVHLGAAHPSAALEDFNAALRRAPTLAEAHFGRARALDMAGNIMGARREYQLALDGGYPLERLLFPLAEALFKIGEPAEARRRLQQLLKLRPGDHGALAMLEQLDRHPGQRTSRANSPE